MLVDSLECGGLAPLCPRTAASRAVEEPKVYYSERRPKRRQVGALHGIDQRASGALTLPMVLAQFDSTDAFLCGTLRLPLRPLRFLLVLQTVTAKYAKVFPKSAKQTEPVPSEYLA